jgi:hypothetical protein
LEERTTGVGIDKNDEVFTLMKKNLSHWLDALWKKEL